MRAGSIHVLTFLNAEATLLTAEDLLSQAKYAHPLSLVSFYRALRGGCQQQDEGL
jgi:outer membrane protein TolC